MVHNCLVHDDDILYRCERLLVTCFAEEEAGKKKSHYIAIIYIVMQEKTHQTEDKWQLKTENMYVS